MEWVMDPDITFEEMCKVFGIPALRKKAKFCAVSSTSGTATEVTAFSIITDYNKGIKYPIADFEITPDVAIVDPDLAETMNDTQEGVGEGHTRKALGVVHGIALSHIAVVGIHQISLNHYYCVKRQRIG